MPDNLTVQISADSSKLRADLSLAQSKLREFGREVKKAADEARKTGDTTRLKEVSAQYEAMAAQVRGLNRALVQTNQAANVAAKGIGTLGTTAAGAVTSLSNLVKGFAVTAGMSGFFNMINKTKDELLELERMRLATGFDRSTLKAVNETLEDTGAEAGSGYKALTRLAQAFAEVRQEARNAGQQIGNAVNVIRGDEGASAFGVNIVRGGQKVVTEIKNASDAFKALGVDMRRFKDTEEGNRQALQALIDAFARLRKEGKIDIGNQAAMQLFGKGLREMVPLMDQIAKSGGNLNDIIKQLQQTGRDPNQEALDKAKAYQLALKQIGDAADSASYAFLRAFGPDMVAFLAEFEKRIATTRKEIDLLVAAANWLAETAVSLGQKFDESLIRGLDRVTAAAQRAAQAVRELPGTYAAGDLPPMPVTGHASGGMVRGPGSGTSDSIFARLSNGEFVMRAAAVRAWGPQLLSAMNALNRPLRGIGDGSGFANGGMVSARTSDGATVNLHFPGGSFSLRGDRSIVQGLTREARRSALLSGGRLPGAALA